MTTPATPQKKPEKKWDPSRTMADLPKPEASGGGKTGRVDTVLMLEAWEINVAAQRKVINLLERLEGSMQRTQAILESVTEDNAIMRDSNRNTRRSMYVAGACLLITLGWVHHLGAESASRDAEIVRLIGVQSTEVAAMKEALTMVADSNLAADEAATTAAAVAEAVESAPPPSRWRQTPEQVLAEVHRLKDLAAKREAAREARLVASVKATRAVVKLAPDAPTKARAAMKLRKAEGRARAASLDVNAF